MRAEYGRSTHVVSPPRSSCTDGIPRASRGTFSTGSPSPSFDKAVMPAPWTKRIAWKMKFDGPGCMGNNIFVYEIELLLDALSGKSMTEDGGSHEKRL
jgi:hypothetical protein